LLVISSPHLVARWLCAEYSCWRRSSANSQWAWLWDA